MAQAFVTTYDKFFRWHEIERRPALRPVDKLAEALPEGDIWIVPKHIGEDDEEGGSGLAAAEVAIKRMYRKRLWTTYQVDYCADMIPKEHEEKGESLDSALLLYCKSLYSPKKQKIPPPLPTARRIYGYIRPSRMYVPLSTYQTLHGKIAYSILDQNSRSSQGLDKENKSTDRANAPLNKTREELKKGETLTKQKRNEKRIPILGKALGEIGNNHTKLCACSKI